MRCLRIPLRSGSWLRSRFIIMSALSAVAILALTTLAAIPLAAQTGTTPTPPTQVPSQFGNFVPPAYNLDNVQGEIVNLEPQLIEPVLVTSDDRFVVVANDPDNRVVVLNAALTAVVAEIPVGQGIVALAERPVQAVSNPDGEEPTQDETRGEIWVSLRHQNAVMVINSLTWRVTHVLRPPIPVSGQGARSAANPGGIAFNANGTKAYVAASSTDELVVYDAAAKSFLTTIPLTRTHNGAAVRQNDPMAVVFARGSIWVASHLSGNQTVVDALGSPLPGTFGPGNVVVKDLVASGSADRLPDLDIVQVNPATDTVVSHISDVGTILFGMDAHPNGNLVVANLEAENGTFVGEGAFPNGRVTLNRVTYASTGGPPTHVVTENLGGAGTHVVHPTDVLVDTTGRVFVAGYASSNIGVFDGSGTFLGAISSPVGPRGLAFSPGLGRLYSLNAASSSVSWYNVSGGGLPAGPSGTFRLPDPTYNDVWFGRHVFLDPTNSGAGTTGCFSCHPDLRKDGQGWQIGAYFDSGSGFSNSSPPSFWKDRKGVMVTQDLRSLPDAPPYHWRGEQKDLEDFNGAFVNLLHGTELTDPEFALMKAFVFSSVYPPNPFQPMNRTYTTNAARGLNHYLNTSSDFAGPCETCHALPSGTDDSITEGVIGLPGTPFAMKTAQLRGLWTKTSGLTDIDPSGTTNTYPSTGFGFAHEGVFDTFGEFNTFFFTAPLGAAGVSQVTQLLDEFDSGLAPCTAWSERLDMVTAGSNRVATYLVPQANAANCDAVAKGRLLLGGTWQTVGLLWDRVLGAWRPDLTSLGTFTTATLQAMAAAGQAELVVLGVPRWSGERIGVDRDRDGIFDGDEGSLGTSPTNPDTDGDGLWDGYDPQPLVTGHPVPAGAPAVVPGSVKVWNTLSGPTTGLANAIKVTYETDTFSPTYLQFGPTGAYGFLSGDPFPMATGAGTPNLWRKRHTAFIRPQPAQSLVALDDGALVNFRVVTQGQNNAFGTSANFTANTRADAIAPSDRVSTLTLNGVRSGPNVTWSATVTVVDNNGVPLAGAVVTGRFTHYQGTLIAGQATPTGVTNGVGQVTLTSTFVQSPGDKTVFDLPMTLAGVSSITPVNPSFHWPEGPSMVDQLAP